MKAGKSRSIALKLRGIYDTEHQMIRTPYKDMAYEALRWLTYPNSWIKRLHSGWLPGTAPYKLHLGCGRQYVQGWVNSDINPTYRKDLWLDLRNPWPIRQGEVSHIYSLHVFEHFDLIDLRTVLSECLRVLRAGGVMRVVVPSLEKAISCYLRNDFGCLGSVDTNSKSPGRKFNDTVVYHGQHKILFDKGFLEEVLVEAGFSSVRFCEFRESKAFDQEDLSILERDDHSTDSIYAEASRE